MKITFEAETIGQIVEACRDLVQKYDDGNLPELWKIALISCFMEADEDRDGEARDFYRDWFREVA